MSALLSDKVLVINKKWQAVDETTVAEAMCDMCSGKATGIDTEFMLAVPWKDWLSLVIREGDRQLRSIHGPVRIPTVVGKFSYEKMPKRKPKLGNRGIRDRDSAVCQVTGEYAPDGNVDHLTPRSRGGKDSWENMAWMKKGLNSMKGSHTLEEMGWKLQRKPVVPKEQEACLIIRPKHPDWLTFLPKG
jgi:5-methylcytosine-specific restriction endonuclease McrA